jgi:aldehyde:ferredoxin oxidoreductase
LAVDLSKRAANPLEDVGRAARLFVGGRGVATYYFWRFGGHLADPLSGDNPLIFAAGPLTGTGVPMSGRAAAVFRSPLTGILGASNLGGKLGPVMRFAGVDVLVVLGRAERPTYLVVQEGRVEFRDASHLWGMDAIETEEVLLREHGRNAAVLAIGPAGENLVRFASINHDLWRQFGRTGGGAVMGAKKLKAVVFVPEKRQVDVAMPEKLSDFLRRFTPYFVGEKSVKALFEGGTVRLVEIANQMGFFPAYNWQRVSLDGWESVAWPAFKKGYFVKPAACMHCPAACHRLVRSGKYGVDVDIEYETIFALGGLTGCADPDELIKLNDLADRLGMDTISLGGVVAFAIEAAKLGKLNIEVDWGCGGLARLVEDIAYRRGVGDLLAEGVREAARRLGLEHVAVHVRGLEPAGYDPRVLKGMALNYAVGYRGADHLATMAYALDIGGYAGGPQSLGEEKVRAVAYMEEVSALFDSLVLCKFGRGVYDMYPGGRGFDTIAELLTYVTGESWTGASAREAAVRIVNMTRFLNLQMGAGPDSLPERFFKPVRFEDREYVLTREELENALRIYYELRGWDGEGRPLPETLRRLQLDFLTPQGV